MAILNANISVAQPTAAANIYASSGSTCMVTMYLCNTTATAVTCNLYVMASGTTANVANQVYNQLSIGGTDTYIVDTEKLIFGTGDTIKANASVANSIIVTMSYTSI